MIDTLRLSLKDYTITRGPTLEVQPATYRPGTGEVAAGYSNGLFRYTDGETVEGAKAYINNDLFNLTISPGKNGLVHALVQCSIPKVASGSNFDAVNREQTIEAIQRLETALRDNGIHTNLSAARVSRLDLFRTAETDHPFAAYAPLLKQLTGKRQKLRDYGTTFLLHNGEQATCIYDKREEMLARGHDVSGIPDHAMRFEHRLLKGRKVRSALGVSTCGELVQHYDALADLYRETMVTTIFSREPDAVAQQESEELLTWMQHFKETGGLRWWSKFKEDFGERQLSTKYTTDTIRAAILQVQSEDSDSTRRKIDRIIRSLDDAAIVAAMIEPSTTGTLQALFDELRSKIVSV